MILKKPFFLFLFLLVLVIGVLQQFAVYYYWYWLYVWFDILMHFLGGFWFGFSALWILFFSGYLKIPDRKTFGFFVLVAFCSSISVGIAWEIFEYIAGVTSFVDGYVFDTVKDLIMDTFGGIVSAIFLYKAYQKQIIKNNNVIS